MQNVRYWAARSLKGALWAAERGIAGAEIVHRDADAELAGLLPDSAKRWNRFGNRTGRNSPLIGRIERRGPPGSSFGRLFRWSRTADIGARARRCCACVLALSGQSFCAAAWRY